MRNVVQFKPIELQFGLFYWYISTRFTKQLFTNFSFQVGRIDFSSAFPKHFWGHFWYNKANNNVLSSFSAKWVLFAPNALLESSKVAQQKIDVVRTG